jgi:Phage integrase, N-terminal SAM-like domain
MRSQEPSRAGSGGPGAAQRAGAGQPTPRMLEQVRNVMRLHHYSIHTERSYTDWIKRYIHFHHMRSREDLANGESKIEAFCTDLAVNGKVSPSTQNQAFNARRKNANIERPTSNAEPRTQGNGAGSEY